MAPKEVVAEYYYLSTEPHANRKRIFENGVLWKIFVFKGMK
jgi:hypothetical protein